MSCLGGTPDAPRTWHRFRAGDSPAERVEGRICTRQSPRTSRSKCGGCPAFRGLRWDGLVANGLNPDGSPYALSPAELAVYEAALEAMFIDDDTGPILLFESRMSREVIQRHDGTHVVLVGLGDRGLRRIGDPDALDRHATGMRAWRAAHPGADHRKRKRDRAAYMRAYRKASK